MEVGNPRYTNAPRLADDARRGPSLAEHLLWHAQRVATRKRKLEQRGLEGDTLHGLGMPLLYLMDAP